MERPGRVETTMVSDALRAKYGERAIEAGLRLQPKTFAERLALRDSLDQHFTKTWLDFAIEGFGNRRELDERTRFLVLIGQFTMARAPEALEDADPRGARRGRAGARGARDPAAMRDLWRQHRRRSRARRLLPRRRRARPDGRTEEGPAAARGAQPDPRHRRGARELAPRRRRRPAPRGFDGAARLARHQHGAHGCARNTT